MSSTSASTCEQLLGLVAHGATVPAGLNVTTA
jgi:hypothetical protein